MLTTHSPDFLNGFTPDQIRILVRDENGHTQIKKAADIAGIKEFIEKGAKSGDLWRERYFGEFVLE